MRVVSYNILDGGEGRADPLAEVLQAQRADVVALIEAQDMAVLERIARRMGMDFVQAVGKDSKAVALLSRFAIRDSLNHGAVVPQVTQAMLQATIVDPAGMAWNFGVVHLHPRAGEADEQEREKELDVLLPFFQPLRDAVQPHILLGDFNANSPVQQIDLGQCKPATREQAAANGGVIPRRVVQRLLDAGYVDTFAAANPGEAATAGTFTTQFTGQRVDYIFTHSVPVGRIKKAWIEYDRLAKYASDHYPVGVEIE